MNAVEELKRVIKEREEELASLKLALRALMSSPTSGPVMRFQGMKPIDAMRILLPEHGGEMSEEELIDQLVAGGVLIGKSRGPSNIRVSIKANVKTGAIQVKDGRIKLGEGPAVG